MSEPSYLLFIDKSPVSEDLKNYFAQFNIAIVQQQNLLPIDNKLGIPIAILIHWSALNNELQTMHQLYTTYTVPLLVLNDHPDEEVCIRVLEAGADDFIIKPIYPRELHARVSAISRRVLRAKQQVDQDKDVILFTHWRLYPASRRIFSDMKNEELLLSAGEYDLLLAFVQHPQRVLERLLRIAI
jgi:DNA-binding response OmpR family regulator